MILLVSITTNLTTLMMIITQFGIGRGTLNLFGRVIFWKEQIDADDVKSTWSEIMNPAILRL